jgi:hypothetical protein
MGSLAYDVDVDGLHINDCHNYYLLLLDESVFISSYLYCLHPSKKDLTLVSGGKMNLTYKICALLSQGIWIHFLNPSSWNNGRTSTPGRWGFYGWAGGASGIWKCLEAVSVGTQWRPTLIACSLADSRSSSIQACSTIHS